MKKILIILTNTRYYGNSKDKTGLWLAEAAEFVYKVQEHGYQVDYASVNGGEVPLDPRSLKSTYRSKEIDEIYYSNDFQNRALKHSLKVSDLDPQDYFAIYYTGGHGVLWDFPNQPALSSITNSIFKQGGFIMSICHGLAVLVTIKDDQGNYLINNKKITGFTNFEEILSGKLFKVPFLTENQAKKAGAKFVQKRPFASFAVQDGQFITGQNPMSGFAVADLLIKNSPKH